MGRPKATAKLPQQYNEIVADAQQKKQTSKIYKEQAIQLSDDKISNAISNISKELYLAIDQQPVTLSDTETIKKLTIRYFTACEQASIIPSVAGLSRSMGISRAALYDYCKRNPKSATAKWIELVKDAMSNILEESALRNNCNSIISIFLLKAQYGYVDRQTIDINAERQTPLDDLPDLTEVEERYSRYTSCIPPEEIEAVKLQSNIE